MLHFVNASGIVPACGVCRTQGARMSGPISYEQLINTITARYEGMGKRSRDIARYIVQNPNDMALSTAKTIAERTGVQASSLVRFAQALGYDGFNDMQRVFQSRLVTAAPSYVERLEALRRDLGGRLGNTKVGLVREVAIRDIAALQRLIETIEEPDLETAAAILKDAPTIHVLGHLRAYPVAAYFHYALTRLRRDVRLIDGMGGLGSDQADLVDRSHCLIAISFRHYAREVVDIVERLADNQVPIIAITDSQLSPLAKRAAVTFLVPEAENNFAHSLAAPICIAQGLVMAMAHAIRPDVAAEAISADTLRAPAGL